MATMTNRMDLSERYRILLEELLDVCMPEVEVWVFGSRINGRSYDGSDLDLVLRGARAEEIPRTELSAFKHALSESKSPDSRRCARLGAHTSEVQQDIERDYVVLRNAHVAT